MSSLSPSGYSPLPTQGTINHAEKARRMRNLKGKVLEENEFPRRQSFCFESSISRNPSKILNTNSYIMRTNLDHNATALNNHNLCKDRLLKLGEECHICSEFWYQIRMIDLVWLEKLHGVLTILYCETSLMRVIEKKTRNWMCIVR